MVLLTWDWTKPYHNYDTILYLQSFLLHDIRALFCHVYLRSFLLCGVFIPKCMTIFLQTRIYMRHIKAHIYSFSSPEPLGLICNRKRRALGTRMIYIRYKQACVYGVTESRRIRGTELYRQQKTPSCTMELKSNFSLNQAWPQWPR